ncbi:hypothetical protein A2392_03020 [Candidatus Kaiserbacteria bacterium RIFOXYB1_FULL_46_14]|uniref:Uncharacterized protein n=1 Tax=Candidatus Kaiserbacteria bacterium RIFOXYB1_FULL_46_14 TaxID=1798531 RepID=A0A1F6FIR8_9BACT|nr:MAG: hypothetical protein A2392_03020 [Candidatus Kaiserbacteria bacterium RIFOXYB1_FULL_46_14]
MIKIFSKKTPQYLNRFFILTLILYVVYVIYKVIDLQSIFTASSTVSRPWLYFVIAYLYIWWFTKFENLKFKFWKTETKILYSIFIKFLYFCIFTLEVVIATFIATNFDELFLQIWALLVGILLFFVLYKLRRHIESLHKTRRFKKSEVSQTE